MATVMIMSAFQDNGIPALLLTPAITIYDLSDDSVVINAAAMSEVANGIYKYSFGAYTYSNDYAIYVDGGVALDATDRYQYGSNETEAGNDVWITALPGAYGAGTAGNILGNLETDTCSCVTSWFAKHISAVTNVLTGDDIEILRGDTLTIQVARLGDISTRDKVWFTLKADKDDADTASWILIEETVGLVYIDGETATVPGNGSIVVTDAVVGNLTITLAAVETAKLKIYGNLYYDIQVLFDDGTVGTLVAERAVIVGDVTRAVD